MKLLNKEETIIALIPNQWMIHLKKQIKSWTSTRYVGLNLARRNIQAPTECIRCTSSPESQNHTLFTCLYAQAVWRVSGLSSDYLCNPLVDIHDKLRYIFIIEKNTFLDMSLRLLPFWIMWRLWKSRNALYINHESFEVASVVSRAFDDTTEWILHTKPDCSTLPSSVSAQTCTNDHHWTRPDPGLLKCNYDASHNKSFGSGVDIKKLEG